MVDLNLTTVQTEKANQRILFAGAEFASQFNGYMEGAILSGQKAAKTLMQTITEQNR